MTKTEIGKLADQIADLIQAESRARGRAAARRPITYASRNLTKTCTLCIEPMQPNPGETLSEWNDRKTHQTQKCRDKARAPRPNTDLGRDAKPIKGLEQWGGGYCANATR